MLSTKLLTSFETLSEVFLKLAKVGLSDPQKLENVCTADSQVYSDFKS